MTGDVTRGYLKKLSFNPDSQGPGTLIAGQEYFDVFFTGGSIDGVNLGQNNAGMADFTVIEVFDFTGQQTQGITVLGPEGESGALNDFEGISVSGPSASGTAHLTGYNGITIFGPSSAGSASDTGDSFGLTIFDVSYANADAAVALSISSQTAGGGDALCADIASGNFIIDGTGNLFLTNVSANFYGGAKIGIGPLGAGSWIDMPVNGPSGLGSGGAGTNPWIAYAQTSGQWFSDAAAADICYRAQSGKFLRLGAGNGSGPAPLVIGSNTQSKSDFIQGTAALATTATGPFLWIPSCAGVPTGSPTAPYTGAVALVIDSTDNKIYARIGSSWKGVTVA